MYQINSKMQKEVRQITIIVHNLPEVEGYEIEDNICMLPSKLLIHLRAYYSMT